jgi:ketopantoate reductase
MKIIIVGCGAMGKLRGSSFICLKNGVADVNTDCNKRERAQCVHSDLTTRIAILSISLRSFTLTSPMTNSSAFVILLRPMITIS